MTQRLDVPEAMLFDLDGTLFRTESILIPAYHATFDKLREEGVYNGQTPPEDRILSSLGLLLPEIWRRVMPDASLEARRRADYWLLRFQLEGLKRGEGELYEGVAETLQELHRRGIRLFVASNGLEHYVKGVVHHKGLDSLFEGVYSAGEYDTPSKVDLVRICLERHRIERAWMVGDRSSDVEACKRNGLTVIGCNYARFGKAGELDGADRVIARFDELLHLTGS